MFNEIQLKEWLCTLDFSGDAEDYINLVRLSEPSRRVQGGRGNVRGNYPSHKMGRTIQFESHTNELAFILILEFDPEVIEYWDQPPVVKLQYLTESGRHHAGYYTPDFFVIKQNRAGWVECKTENELIKLSKNPNRYYFDEKKWRCPPGEALANQQGFFFQVYSSNETNWFYLRNIRFLEDYFFIEAEIDSEISARIISLVSLKSRILLSELLLICQQFNIPSDYVYRLIAIQFLYVDLETVLLTHPTTVHVFVSCHHSQTYLSNNFSQSFLSSSVNWDSGDSLIWDGNNYEIINRGESSTWLKAESGNVVSIDHQALISLYEQGQIHIISQKDVGDKVDSNLSARVMFQASPSAIEEANRRYKILITYANTGEILLGTSLRSIRRWQSDFREAEITLGSGYLGLIDKKRDRGNRLAKLPLQTLEISDKYIEEIYESSKQPTVYSVWTKLKLECESRGIIAPSYTTFNLRVKSRSRHEQEIKRRGRVAAYQFEEFYYELSPTAPKHGERPFEIVHIDHTELDIELICSQTGKNLGRPWLTLIIDAYSRRCLGFYLSFDPPSYRSCMMVIRAMVQRYHRFPQTIVVDGGLDFSSIYFESLLARYNCTLKIRPGKKPRFGTLIERLFLTNNKQFIYNLLGNTQLAKDNVRYLVEEFNPKNLAVWTIEYLYYTLGQYLFETYERMEHSTLGVSPCEMFLHGIASSGERSHKTILYDENFKLMTLPTTKTGLAKIYPGQGVVINYIHYWTSLFRNSQIENIKVPVRFDPFNTGIAYAYVDGWQRCLSTYYDVFNNRTEREILMVAAEIKALRKRRGRFTLNAKILAQFLLNVDATENELLLLQRQKDLEIKRFLNKADVISDYPLSEVDNNTIKLLSAQPDLKIPTEENALNTDDSPVDISTLKIFGDY